MATKTFKGRIQNKHDTEANWSVATNFKPLAGELIIYDKDNTHSTPRFKVGDGSTLVSNLPFVNGTMKFGTDSFSYEDGAGNIGTFGPMSIELNNSTYKAVYDTTSIGYKNISTDVAYDLNFPTKSGTFAVTSDIDVTAAGNNTFTGTANTFTNQVNLQGLVRIGKGNSITILSSTSTGLINVKLPSKAGTLALTSDIDVTAAGNNTFTGKNLINTDPVNLGGSNRYKTIDFSNYDSIKVGWKQSNTLDSNWYNYTRYADGAIHRSLTGVDEVSYLLPNKGGTLALTSDIDVTAAGNNIFTGTNTFKTETSDNLFRTLIDQNGISVGGGPATSGILIDVTYGLDNIKRLYGGNTYTYTFPNKNGIFATMNDIPNVAPLAKLAQDNTFTGTNTYTFDETETTGSLYRTLINQNGVSVGAGPRSGIMVDTTYGINNIRYSDSGTTTTYTYAFPQKSGTFALTSDIPIKTATLSGTTLSITLS